MARIEDLADQYGRHIATPWQRTVAGAQRIIMLVYDKELERTLRARKLAFETATKQSDHDWFEVDLTACFAEWMAEDEYRDEYFSSPDDLQLKLEAEFPSHVSARLSEALRAPRAPEKTVVAVFGVGSLFGLARVSQILRSIESEIEGRLLIFFPGQADRGNFRLLDARDGWNYLAVTIAANSDGEIA